MNKRLALTNINQLVRNIFSNCHQLPTWRNTPNGTTLVPMWTLISNLSSAIKTDVKPPTTNTSKQNDSQLELLCFSLTLVISQSFLSDKERTPSTGNTRDRDRSDQKKSSGESLTLSPSILGPVDLCFSKGVCSSIASARDRLDQKQPPRETLTSPDDNSNDLAKTTTYPLSVSHTPNPFSSPPVAKITIDLLSVSHTFNPLLSPLAKITTYPLSVSHTLNPFSSPPVSAKEHVSVTPNSVKTIKPFNPHAAVVAVAAAAAVPVYRTRRCEPRLELRPALPNLIQLEKNLLSKNRFESDHFCSNYGFIDLTNIGPRLIYIYSCDLHSAPPKHGILILNG